MKAATSSGWGLARLVVNEVPRPKIGANEVLVEVHASSVNPKDWKVNTNLNRLFPRLGKSIRPLVLGDDLAGVVIETGRDVTGVNVGDSVYGMTMNPTKGALAEYARISQRCIALKPNNLNYAEAAVVPLAGLTALQALRLAEVHEGSQVLVIGASGGVGTFAVQLAKAQGATVTGVCSGPNRELVLSLGADSVIDYTREDFLNRSDHYDAVLDITSFHSLAKCSSLMTDHGIYVTTLGNGAAVLNLARGKLFHGRGQKAKGVAVDANTADLDQLRAYIEKGEVKPVIDGQYELADVAQAYERSKSGHAVGKIAINVR